MTDHDHTQEAHDQGSSDRENDPAITKTTPSALLIELREHVPFSVSAVAIGLVVAGTICILGSRLAGTLPMSPESAPTTGQMAADAHEHDGTDSQAGDHGQEPRFAGLFFHLFHPAHMLFSAAATTAMFRRYERKTFKAILIGLIGAIGICGISDIAMPHVSLLLLGQRTPLHLCVVQHPDLVLPFAGVGVLIGVAMAGSAARTTIVSHSLHVLASTMASIFYMVGPLGLIGWIGVSGQVFVFVVLAVMVPCCLSDIVFPLLMSHAGKSQYHRDPHTH